MSCAAARVALTNSGTMAEPYKELLRPYRGSGGEVPRKKRRTNKNVKQEVVEVEDEPQEVIKVEDESATSPIRVDSSSEDDWDSDDFEDVPIESDTRDVSVEQSLSAADLSGSEPESDSPGYEEMYNFDAPAETDESITVTLKKPEEAPKSNRRKRVPISREQRELRRLIHKLYLGCMLVHGQIRNAWCNDYALQLQLKQSVPRSLKQWLFPEEAKVLDVVKLRRFLDGVQQLHAMYHRRFKVTGKGLQRPTWVTLGETPEAESLLLDKFRSLVVSFKGLRDVGGQGFVALLRAVGLHARLVYSIQPPDWTAIMEEADKGEKQKSQTPLLKTPTPPPNKKGPGLLEKIKLGRNGRLQLLAQTRKQHVKTETAVTEVSSAYPIFWTEVWNKFSRKWISVDPVVLNVLELAPMRRKSRFEPPQLDPTNQLWYAIAFDKYGGVKDVTRRYTQYYNARTIKKRIGFRSDDDNAWYQRLLRGISRRRQLNLVDVLEAKEFHNRDLAEGIPNNIADFKNHPVYALENQLRQNEVIYPHDDSSKCGTFRPKTKAQTVVPIYKRSHVYQLRSARAWYMRGRVLKVAVQPLKEREARNDDDDDTRLYAEFQTQLYIPPPVTNGQVPKNAYGNIDVYTPTMIPEGAVLIPTTKYPMRMLDRAAKYILEVDYARAVIGFDFGSKRSSTAREGGIVIAKEYEEALTAVLEALVEEAEDRKREEVEVNSLRNWKFFLTKLRIMARLDRDHGVVEPRRRPTPIQGTDGSSPESDFSVHDASDYGGGFVPQDGDYSWHNRHADGGDDVLVLGADTTENVGGGHVLNGGGFLQSLEKLDEDDEFEPGGFEVDEAGGFDVEATGADENFAEAGGFELSDYEIAEDLVEAVEESDASNKLDDLELPDELFSTNAEGELVYNPVDQVEEAKQETPSDAETGRSEPLLKEDVSVTETAAPLEVTALDGAVSGNGIAANSESAIVPTPTQETLLSEEEYDAAELERIHQEEEELGIEYSDEGF